MCTQECLPAARRGPTVTRRAALFGAAAAAASAATAAVGTPASAATAAVGTPATAAAGAPVSVGERAGHHLPGGRRGLRDLTHPLTTSFPAFAPGEEASRRTHVTIEDDGYYMQEWRILEHYGTHVDAPGHFAPGGRLSTELRPAELILPAVVIDIADRAARDPDTTVTVEDLRAFERRYGRIPRDAAVLMHSGWGAKVGDADAYRGTDPSGALHFPGFSADACEWLLSRRRVRSLGVDTLSIDPGNSTTFDTHVILNGADRYGLENLANLGGVPRRGATVIVGLIPYQDGSGGQARVLAVW